MTFTEAAAQVLRLVGKPLHYKEITDVAIEKNLLSHVGKSPEVTMGARLAALVKKGDRDNPLIRVKPGVFALREWDRETIEKGLADRTPALERLAQAFGDKEIEDEGEEATEPPAETGSAPRPVLEDEETPPDEDELRRAQIAARANDLFAPEADDELPIFARPDAPPPAQTDTASDDDDGLGGDPRRRRRRRRRGRGGDEPRGNNLPSYTVSDAPPLEEGFAEAEAVSDARGEQLRAEPRIEARLEPRAEGRLEPRAEGRLEPRAEGRPDARNDRETRGEPRPPERMLDDLAGRELADAVVQLLSAYDRNRGPVGLQALAEGAVRRGRLNDVQTGQVLIAAAARADNMRRVVLSQRPRFRIAGNRLGLTDWLLDGELSRLERDLMATSDRFRDASRRLLLRKLQELPQRAVGELVLLVLERAGLSDLQVVRRTGTHGAELHLSARTSGAGGEIRAAVVVRRDGREVGRERVTELRGALHHYGPASAGWLVTTGQVLSGAREEASANGAAPVTLVDGLGLARLCEENGIGVLKSQVSLSLPDVDLLDALRMG